MNNTIFNDIIYHKAEAKCTLTNEEVTGVAYHISGTCPFPGSIC